MDTSGMPQGETQGAGAPPSQPPPASWAPPPPPPGPAPGLTYAGFGVRLVALIIDFIIVGIISGAVASVLGLGFVGFYGANPGRIGDVFAFNLVGPAYLAYVVVAAIISGAYFVYSWRAWSATPGQRVMNMQVRNAADGSSLTQDQAIRRWAFLTVPIISALPAIGGLVFLYQLFLAYTTYGDPRKQGFHDKQVGSVVVRLVA